MPIDGAMSRTLTAVNGFSCAIGSLGNLALIAIILLHRQLHGVAEILLVSLAVADFVSCGVYLPLLIVRLNTNKKLPTTMNQSRRAIGQAAIVCVSLNLLMLTVDRLIFFYRPLRYTFWLRKRVVIMAIIIIYGISLFVGFYAYYDMIKSQYLKIVLVGLPMLFFFTLHYAIYRLASTHRNQVANQEQSLKHNYSITSSAIVQARRNVRTVMLFGILYMLTWLPMTIFQLWRSVTNYHDPKSFQKYFYLLLTIQQTSACIDPYLCCYRNNKVKAVLVRKLMAIRRSGLGGIPANTTSSSLSDGLNSHSGRGKRILAGVGKPACVSESLENILSTKHSAENRNSVDSLDKTITTNVADVVKPAPPNDYESFKNINKFKSFKKSVSGMNEDASSDGNDAKVHGREQTRLNVLNGIHQTKDSSNVEVILTVSAVFLRSMNIPDVSEEAFRKKSDNIIVDSQLNIDVDVTEEKLSEIEQHEE